MRLPLLFLLVFTNTIVFAQTTDIEKVFSDIETIYKQYNTENENKEQPSRYSYLTVAQYKERAGLLREQAEILEKISSEKLTHQQNISKEIMLMKLKNELSFVDYQIFFMPFNSEGGFYNHPVFILNKFPFASKKDYENYFDWLAGYTQYIEHNIQLLKQGIEEKVMRPKVVVKNTLNLMELWIDTDIDKNPFYQPFKKIPATINQEERKQLQEKGKTIISAKILPVYKKLYNFFEEEYLPSAPSQTGIKHIKKGKAYYEDRVKFYTTLNITPDSVFNLGMKEVKRIRNRMDTIISDLNFKGTFNDFIIFLRTDRQFYAKTPMELLSRAAWLSKKSEGELPSLFKKLYELPFTVKPVPEEIAPNYTAGRYVPGNMKKGTPGIYWVNTHNLPSRPLYNLPALTLHEAVPGHHLGITIARELNDIPDFRKNYYISAYGEGWGLYAEFLGEEMNMYTTPYELFGRFTYEMWRACRLVVDVGIHYKDWTREEAVNFLADNTALSLHEVNTEIDRYIGWPGQALSYKMGEITIKQLREKADKKLRKAFDIKDFHEVILKNGAVTLPVLSQEVENYINNRLTR
ncbi:DUF885 domain-containing protein [Abyssalbus ytuae]|uniref:DUF885 domain-containing protein n=1 Tax=Abyssalbus ytuae TaxID=2926907 RepID=A0A9E6ZXK4_9FLAO|nr:DUF885 domain-containing protein [Abyssalbus ytuae]UOB17017.1 DUF885 domain-containing protein [Abyssalbus ytuae]